MNKYENPWRCPIYLIYSVHEPACLYPCIQQLRHLKANRHPLWMIDATSQYKTSCLWLLNHDRWVVSTCRYTSIWQWTKKHSKSPSTHIYGSSCSPYVRWTEVKWDTICQCCFLIKIQMATISSCINLRENIQIIVIQLYYRSKVWSW